jgi:argininosuccinate synthase
MTGTVKKTVVVAYSGGLDTSYCLSWLRKERGFDVVSVTVDTGGFKPGEIAALEARARNLKVIEHITVPARDKVYEKYVTTIIRGNVLRGNVYPLCVAAERVTQAEEVAAIAKARKADAVAHGSTGAGNDQVRFDVAFQVLIPTIPSLAPIREMGLSRAQEFEYLKREGVEIDPAVKDYSINAGLWGATIGGKETHDPWRDIPEDVWPSKIAPGTPARDIVLGFERGVPVALDGARMSGTDVIAALGQLDATYGFGRGIHLGDTVLGIKGRVAFQAGAALLLIAAHRELEKLILTGWQRFWKDHVSDFWGKLLHEAQVFDPVMKDIRALIDSSQEHVAGDVRIRLTPGRFMVTGVKSPASMMRKESGTYGEAMRLWDGRDAEGFGRILGIPGRLANQAGAQ